MNIFKIMKNMTKYIKMQNNNNNNSKINILFDMRI